MRTDKTAVVLCLFAVLFGAWATDVFAGDRLSRIERSLEEESRIKQVGVGQVSSRMANKSKRLHLYDVRSEEEYAISHLPGALRLDPEADPEIFFSNHVDILKNEEVVFYCSVGRRATALAESVAGVMDANGIESYPVNMKGGIFRWHNETMPLENSDGSTDIVHSFSWFWQFLLARRENSVH